MDSDTVACLCGLTNLQVQPQILLVAVLRMEAYWSTVVFLVLVALAVCSLVNIQKNNAIGGMPRALAIANAASVTARSSATSHVACHVED